jgi:hypothetical protein
MLASALDEVFAAVQSGLPAAITSIAAKYSITLSAPASYQRYWGWRTQESRTSWPAVTVSWADSDAQLTRPSAGVRDSRHRVKVAYGFRSSVTADVERHAKYIPEAILLWLDSFPIATRSAGKTITKIAPPLGNKIAISQSMESAKEDNVSTTVFYVSDTVVEFEVEVRDPSPAGGAVATATVTPNPITGLNPTATQQLTVTLKDASNNVLVGRTIAYVAEDPTICTVSSGGLVTGVAGGTKNVYVQSEGITATVPVTVTGAAGLPTAIKYVAGVDTLAGVGFSANTRAGSATYVDVNGILRTAGANTWREADYWGGRAHLTIEPAETNLVTQHVPDGTWTLTGASLSTGLANAPDGTSTAVKLIAAVGAGTHKIAMPGLPAGGATSSTAFYSGGAIFAKAAEQTKLGLKITNQAGEVGYMYVDLTNGNVLSTTGSTIAVPKRFVNQLGATGWYRIAQGIRNGVGAGQWIAEVWGASADADNASYTGDGTSGVLIWGGMFAFNVALPGSHIYTTGSQVSRVADNPPKIAAWANIPNIDSPMTMYSDIWDWGVGQYGTLIVGDVASAAPRSWSTEWFNYGYWAQLGVSPGFVVYAACNNNNTNYPTINGARFEIVEGISAERYHWSELWYRGMGNTGPYGTIDAQGATTNEIGAPTPDSWFSTALTIAAANTSATVVNGRLTIHRFYVLNGEYRLVAIQAAFGAN